MVLRAGADEVLRCKQPQERQEFVCGGSRLGARTEPGFHIRDTQTDAWDKGSALFHTLVSAFTRLTQCLDL